MLVTGADGFIGHHLLRHLAEVGSHITACVEQLPRPGAGGHSFSQIEWIKTDLRHAPGVRRAVERAQPEIVFHLAAVGVSDPFLPIQVALRVNLEGTLNLLRALQGAARLVVARTPSERDALNVYSASKAAAWSFCRMFARTEGWPVLGAMIFQCYGPGQSSRSVLPAALSAARAGQDLPMSPGEQIRDWTYVDDVVTGLARIAVAHLHPGDSVELGTGVGTPLREVVARLFALVGEGGRPLPGQLPYRPGEEMCVVADADATARQIGWRASTTLEEGLRQLAAAGKQKRRR